MSPTLDAYLNDLVAYVLRPERSVTLLETVESLTSALGEGASFAEALGEVGRDVPRAEAKSESTGLTCGDPDWRPRPASAKTSVARTCSWGVLLLPSSARSGGSSADETMAVGVVPQPLHGDICPGQEVVGRLCLGPGDVPERTARNPQTVVELLMWNRALHDEEFRARSAHHYGALDAGAAPVYQALMSMLGREPRPPFTPETIGAVCTAVAEGLALRASIDPGFCPNRTFGWIILALIPLLTRLPGDKDDTAGWVKNLGLEFKSAMPAHPAPRLRLQEGPGM